MFSSLCLLGQQHDQQCLLYHHTGGLSVPPGPSGPSAHRQLKLQRLPIIQQEAELGVVNAGSSDDFDAV
jgi:hypothetical protein